MPILVDINDRVQIEVKGKPIRYGIVKYIGDLYSNVYISKYQ